MSDTPRMNMAKSSNERYSIGCQIERELAEAKARIVQFETALRNAIAEYYLELNGEYPSDGELETILKNRMKLAKEAMDGK